MMFVPHREHTYGPQRSVTGIALLFQYSGGITSAHFRRSGKWHKLWDGLQVRSLRIQNYEMSPVLIDTVTGKTERAKHVIMAQAQLSFVSPNEATVS
jgi:hypothetical protein